MKTLNSQIGTSHGNACRSLLIGKAAGEYVSDTISGLEFGEVKIDGEFYGTWRLSSSMA